MILDLGVMTVKRALHRGFVLAGLLHGSLALAGTPDEIRVPGERAYRERARLACEGIEIDRRIHDALSRLAEGKAR